jgi:ABC-type transport system involved in Fe-S cluster assembly fused permease/ATPase subunit
MNPLMPRLAIAQLCVHLPLQVILFNNQQQEVTQYDIFLSQYQAAMNNIENLAATLNAGQATITNGGIMAALVAAVALTPGGISPGDLILIQGMLLQLWAPLQFLGYFFRCAGLACDSVVLRTLLTHHHNPIVKK